MRASENTVLQQLSPVAVNGLVLRNTCLLRLDLLNPPASGNKYYKLKNNLAAVAEGHRVLSFGGAWSNHIHALAALGSERGIPTIGLIRGEKQPQLSPTLRDAEACGMQLHFVSRSDYRRRQEPAFLAELQSRFAPCHIIAEGGATAGGVSGCREIVRLIDGQQSDYDIVAVACGTGATLAGVACELADRRLALGISVLKGAVAMNADIHAWVQQANGHDRFNWRVEHGFHCGGYARHNEALRQFMLAFEGVQGIPLDPVYTGKLLYALYQLQAQGVLDPDRKIVAVHSGGLQGRRGFSWLNGC